MIDMKSKNMGGIFPWPKAIAHSIHRGMSRYSSGYQSKSAVIGVVGATDGSELRLVNYDQNISIDRVNASGAVVWAQNLTSLRAGGAAGNFILCSFYDSADACIYVLTNGTNQTDMYLDRINIANGSVTHVGGTLNGAGFVGTGVGSHKMCRKVPGVGNLIVTKNDGTQGILRLELNATTGAIASPAAPMAAPNGVVADTAQVPFAIGYFSADGIYHFSSINSSSGSANLIAAGKNGFTIGIRTPTEGFGMLSGNYGTNWTGEIVVVDANTVAFCSYDFGTRYFNRIDFDKWLKTIVDSQGI